MQSGPIQPGTIGRDGPFCSYDAREFCAENARQVTQPGPIQPEAIVCDGPFCSYDARKLCAAFAGARRNATNPNAEGFAALFNSYSNVFGILTNARVNVVGSDVTMTGLHMLCVHELRIRMQGMSITLILPTGKCVWADNISVQGNFALCPIDRARSKSPILPRAEGMVIYFDAGCQYTFQCDRIVPKETMYVIAWSNTFAVNGTRFALGKNAVAAAVFGNTIISV